MDLEKFYNNVGNTKNSEELQSLTEKVVSLSSPMKFTREYMSDEEIENLIQLLDAEAMRFSGSVFVRILECAPSRPSNTVNYI